MFGEFIRNVELCKKNYEKAKIDFEESKENLNFVSKKYDEIFQQENDFAVLKASSQKKNCSETKNRFICKKIGTRRLHLYGYRLV